MGLAPPLTRSQPLGLSVALWRESAVVPWKAKASREGISSGGDKSVKLWPLKALTFNSYQVKRIYG